MQSVQVLVESIVKILVTLPDEVRVVQTTDDLGILLTVHVNSKDMGVVIGKAGETINTIRKFVRSGGKKIKTDIFVKVAEPTR